MRGSRVLANSAFDNFHQLDIICIRMNLARLNTGGGFGKTPLFGKAHLLEGKA